MRLAIVGATLALVAALGLISKLDRDPAARAGEGDGAPHGGRPRPPAPPDWLGGTDGLHAPGPNDLDIRWLGVAGFEIRSAKGSLLIDPYLSRTPLWELLTKPATPNMALVHQYVRPVQAVFISHAHFDHFLDAPAIAKEQHIPLYASDQAQRIAEAAGVPAELRHAETPGMVTRVGDIEVEAVESRHSDMPTQYLAGGDVPAHVSWPLRFLDFHNGPTFGYLIRWRGRTIYHSGSAQIVDAAVNHRHADLALFCLTGWTSTPHLFDRVNEQLAPRVFIPMHDDDFFQPLAKGWVENPLAKRAAGLDAIRAAMPNTSLVTIDFLQTVRLKAAGGTP